VEPGEAPEVSSPQRTEDGTWMTTAG